MPDIDDRMQLLLSRYGGNLLMKKEFFEGFEFDKEGFPIESLKRRILERYDEDNPYEMEKYMHLYRWLESIEDKAVILSPGSNVESTRLKTNFGSRVRYLIRNSGADIERPVYIGLDGVLDPASALASGTRSLLEDYLSEYSKIYADVERKRKRLGTEGFGELTKYAVAGQLISVIGGIIGDRYFKFGQPVIESIIRMIGGEGENIPYAFVQLRNMRKSSIEAELFKIEDVCCRLDDDIDHDHRHEHDDTPTDDSVFVKWKLIGAIAPPFVDLASRALGVDINAAGIGVFPAFFYPVSDTMFAQAALWYNNVRRNRNHGRNFFASLKQGTLEYFSKPSTWLGLGTIGIAFGAGFAGRQYLYQDNKYVISALEAAATNLCVVTPVGTAIYDYAKLQKPLRELTEVYAQRFEDLQ